MHATTNRRNPLQITGGEGGERSAGAQARTASLSTPRIGPQARPLPPPLRPQGRGPCPSPLPLFLPPLPQKQSCKTIVIAGSYLQLQLCYKVVPSEWASAPSSRPPASPVPHPSPSTPHPPTTPHTPNQQRGAGGGTAASDIDGVSFFLFTARGDIQPMNSTIIH